MADNFVKQFYQGTGLGTLAKDYKHASKIFVAGNHRLAPKFGFLFHVAFDINLEVSRQSKTDILEAGMLVKTMQLPKYTVENKTYNAYNRVNIAQTKLKYEPVTITFHDDNSDIIRDMWYDYMSYYYRDTDYEPAKYLQETKYNTRENQSWGYTPSKVDSNSKRLIERVRLYSLHQKRFTEYVLINPQITSFQHGEHQQGENNFMQNTMTLSYETVLYNYGDIVSGQNINFADLHYDHTPSPLGIPSLAESTVSALTNGAGVFGGLLGGQDRVDHQLPGDRTKFTGATKPGGLSALANQIALGVSKGNNPFKNLSVPVVAGYAATLTGSGGIMGILGSSGGPNYATGLTLGTTMASGATSAVSWAARQFAPSPGTKSTSNGETVSSDNPELDPTGSLAQTVATNQQTLNNSPELDATGSLAQAVAANQQSIDNSAILDAFAQGEDIGI